MASSTRRASNVRRMIADPPGKSRTACVPWHHNASRLVGTASGGSARCPSPAIRSASTPSTLRQPPQTFERGKADFSTSSVRVPERESCRAASAPAGPAPMTSTSQSTAAAQFQSDGPGLKSQILLQRLVARSRRGCRHRLSLTSSCRRRRMGYCGHGRCHCNRNRWGQHRVSFASFKPLRSARFRASARVNASARRCWTVEMDHGRTRQ